MLEARQWCNETSIRTSRKIPCLANINIFHEINSPGTLPRKQWQFAKSIGLYIVYRMQRYFSMRVFTKIELHQFPRVHCLLTEVGREWCLIAYLTQGKNIFFGLSVNVAYVQHSSLGIYYALSMNDIEKKPAREKNRESYSDF